LASEICSPLAKLHKHLKKFVFIPFRIAYSRLPLLKLISLIAIDNVLISEDVVEAQFVCDLTSAKAAAAKTAMPAHRWRKRN
jgi:hypothetical protein